MANPITINTSIRPDINLPQFEVVNFTNLVSGDYYDSKKFGRVEGTWVSQKTTDDIEIQASFVIKADGQPRITLVQSSGIPSGCLIIVGRK